MVNSKSPTLWVTSAVLLISLQGASAHAGILSFVKDTCQTLLGSKEKIVSAEARIFELAGQIEFAAASLNQQEIGSEIQLKLYKNQKLGMDLPLQVVALGEDGGRFNPDLNFGYAHDGKEGRVYLKLTEVFGEQGIESFEDRAMMGRRAQRIEQEMSNWSIELEQTRRLNLRFKIQEGTDIVSILHEKSKMSPETLSEAEHIEVDLFVFRKLAALIRGESQKMNPDFMMMFQENGAKSESTSDSVEPTGLRRSLEIGPASSKAFRPRMSPF